MKEFIWKWTSEHNFTFVHFKVKVVRFSLIVYEIVLITLPLMQFSLIVYEIVLFILPLMQCKFMIICTKNRNFNLITKQITDWPPMQRTIQKWQNVISFHKSLRRFLHSFCPWKVMCVCVCIHVCFFVVVVITPYEIPTGPCSMWQIQIKHGLIYSQSFVL